jgi:hypothetical protein
LKWLFDKGFNISIAGRSIIGEDQDKALIGYQSLLDDYKIGINGNFEELQVELLDKNGQTAPQKTGSL